MTISKYVSRTPIDKGWSNDLKYCVTDEKGTRYLLRISSLDQFSAKELEFNLMQQVESLATPMCKPIEFGTCQEGVYSIHSWIEGKDAAEVIPLLSNTKAYTYGIEAGQVLKIIHSIPAPIDLPDWEERFNKKIDRKLQNYSDCRIKYDGGEAFIDYIETNRHLLKGRLQGYQHGDYHIGNMMIDNLGQLNIIDFNRYDFGDPWEEFNRIVWCAQSSAPFASGMIDGYFDGNIPLAFWRLLALYIASNTLSSVPWAIPFGQEQVNTMLNQAKAVLNWYDFMQNPVPTWYVREANVLK